MEILKIQSKYREELIEITDKIREIVNKKNLKKGMVFLYVPHTTCGITVNESYDPSVAEDIIHSLHLLAPPKGPYKHTEGNADAHIKTTITGSSLFIFVEEGEIVLGRWQGIFLCEYDGPRTREIYIKLFEER
jgi:secondary thiamine-phosphate synthase enzyme